MHLSLKTRAVIAFGASLGVANAAFRAFTANFGPLAGCVAGVVFTAIVTFGIYCSLGLPLRSEAEQA